jgi:hypothetical protein
MGIYILPLEASQTLLQAYRERLHTRAVCNVKILET